MVFSDYIGILKILNFDESVCFDKLYVANVLGRSAFCSGLSNLKNLGFMVELGTLQYSSGIIDFNGLGRHRL
jgi:hypothetical protein